MDEMLTMVARNGVAHAEYEYDNGVIIHCSYYVRTREIIDPQPHYSVWATKGDLSSGELVYSPERNPMYAESTHRKVDEWLATLN